MLLGFLLVDSLYFAANAPKIFQGGAFPLIRWGHPSTWASHLWCAAWSSDSGRERLANMRKTSGAGLVRVRSPAPAAPQPSLCS